MSALSSLPCRQQNSQPHAEFLKLLPVVEKHARVVFRDRNTVDREEAVAEAVAAALESYVSLKARGKDPVREFPSVMATFAALHVKNDRHVGSNSNSKDVLASRAQQRRGFRVESLSSSPHLSHDCLYGMVGGLRKQDAVEQRLQESRKMPIPDLVAFRIDIRAFLQTLSRRDQKLIAHLASGHSAKATAAKLQLSEGRLCQLRQQWHRGWLTFQGESSPNQ